MDKITDGNKLIYKNDINEPAMQFYSQIQSKVIELYSHPLQINTVPVEGLRYHLDWNWLMPVIEKISRIEFDRQEQELPMGGTEILIHTHYPRTFGMLSPEGKPMFRFNCGGLFIADTLIEAAWEAVVDFYTPTNKQS